MRKCLIEAISFADDSDGVSELGFGGFLGFCFGFVFLEEPSLSAASKA